MTKGLGVKPKSQEVSKLIAVSDEILSGDPNLCLSPTRRNNAHKR
jgi:hypothetical protein